MTYRKLTRNEHFTDPGPKRILALDGGGLRGVLTLGFLSRIEEILRLRYGGDADFRLSHYFDLIAGTSTGAIIAASLAQGMTVANVIEKYISLGRSVFKPSWFRHGLLRARYKKRKLTEELQRTFGTTRRSATTLSKPGS